MNERLLPFIPETAALVGSGVAEILYAILLLIFFRSRWLMVPAIVFPALATVTLMVALPELFQYAFNPFSTNLSLFVLAGLNVLQPAERKGDTATEV